MAILMLLILMQESFGGDSVAIGILIVSLFPHLRTPFPPSPRS